MFCETGDCKLLSIKKKKPKGFVSKNCPLISSVVLIFISISLLVISNFFILINFVLFMKMYGYLPPSNVCVAQVDH